MRYTSLQSQTHDPVATLQNVLEYGNRPPGSLQALKHISVSVVQLSWTEEPGVGTKNATVIEMSARVGDNICKWTKS